MRKYVFANARLTHAPLLSRLLFESEHTNHMAQTGMYEQCSLHMPEDSLPHIASHVSFEHFLFLILLYES